MNHILQDLPTEPCYAPAFDRRHARRMRSCSERCPGAEAGPSRGADRANTMASPATHSAFAGPARGTRLGILAAFDSANRAGGIQGRMLKLITYDVEGYLVGRLAIAALEKPGAELSRDGPLTTIRTTGKFTIGGLVMTFGPDKNDGLDDVFLTVIQTDGSFKPVQKLTM
jgi:hypothetical protein